MKPKPQSPTATKLLLCEGNDEVQFFGALLNHLGRTDVQILGLGGKHGFTPKLTLLVQDPNFPRVTDILIVRDADFIADGAGFAPTWQSITDALRRNGLPVPAGHAAFAPGPPRVVVFVMPDGRSDGMLETLCASAVLGDPATPCVQAYFGCLNQVGISHLPRNTDKASVRVFLASRPEPDKVVGQAAQAGYWPWAAPAFAPLIDLLIQL